MYDGGNFVLAAFCLIKLNVVLWR